MSCDEIGPEPDKDITEGCIYKAGWHQLSKDQIKERGKKFYPELMKELTKHRVERCFH